MTFRATLVSFLFPTLLAAADFHIAPHGSDTNPGSPEAPFATLTGARDALRKLRKESPIQEAITVWLHHGVYQLNEPFLLETQDSGSEAHPITYRAKQNATVTLVGAPKVDLSTFTPHQGNILKADVSALDLKNTSVRQLLLNGQRQTLARYPNANPTDPLYQGWAFLPELPDPLPENHQWKSETYLKPDDIRSWAHPEDVEIDIFAQYGWWNWLLPIKSLDPKTRKLTLAKACGYDLHPHNRFYFQNALEELDAPGEWFLDKHSQTLYFWPAKPLAHNDEIRIPKTPNLIKISRAKHLTIRNLHLTGCIGHAIAIDHSEHITIAACNIHHVGHFNGSGISISAGNNNSAIGNHISHTGNAGISLSSGDRKSLTAANLKADNNHIHHIGIFNKNGPGIGLYGVGNHATHNLIHHTPRMAIQFSGNNLVIEYNHIHHTVQETQDGGAVYTGGRDWISSRGTKLRYNFIHDTIGVGQGPNGLHWPHFTWGIYMDDNAAGLDITNNIVARSARASLHLHNGRDHLIENNIFVDGNERQIEFSGWNAKHRFFLNHHQSMIDGWDAIKDRPEWKNMRNIDFDPRNAVRDDGTIMSGNTFRRNIIAWNHPNRPYIDLRHFSNKYNTVEKNLLWNHHHPIITGLTTVGPNIDPELLQHADLLKKTSPGKAPTGWGWNHKPLPHLQISTNSTLDEVIIPIATSNNPKNKKSVVHAPRLPFKPGTSYRATVKIRSSEPETRISLHYGSFADPGGYWSTPDQHFTATQQWQEIEITGALPTLTSSAYKPWMKSFWLRLDIHGEKGKIHLKDLTINEAQPATDWQAWQTAGWDKNSLIADPHFVSPASDDFRLNPNSPALKTLKFQPIPVEKIGLYPSELRASTLPNH